MVDDEKSIVKGLVETLQQEEEMELEVYSAHTVTKALEIAQNIKLDILCTDIEMPVMNGFELSEKVTSWWKECKVIYLTGYDKFDYIYKAMNEYEGKYLLKSEESTKFIDLIAKCTEEIDREQRRKRNQVKFLQIEDENTYHRQQELFIEFLNNKNSQQDIEILKEIYKDTYMNIEGKVYIVLGKVLRKACNFKQNIMLLSSMKQVEEQYSYFCHAEQVKFYGNMYLITIQIKDQVTQEQLLIPNLLEEIQMQLMNVSKQKISFIYSDQMINFNELREQIKFYKTLLNLKILRNIPVIIKLEEVMKEAQLEHVNYNQYVLQIDKLILEKKFSDLKLIFETLYLSVVNTYELSLISTQMYYKCVEKFIEYIETNIKYLDLPENLRRRYYHLRYLTDVDEIHQFLTLLLQYLSESSEAKELSEEECIIAKIENYILDSITEDISLDKLARLVYFNPSYLSRFYKGIRGKNLSDFIKEAKITKAKELLEKTDKKVSDISKMLGYESIGYFTVFFKKCVGVTPTDYRNRLSF